MNEPYFRKVKGSVRPYPAANYFAAPDIDIYWGVFSIYQISMSPIEGMLTKGEAIEAASRLSLGFKTKKQISESRRIIWGSVLMLFVFCVAVFWSGY
jgi:hypothetical protein